MEKGDETLRPPGTFTTERLILRPPTQSDAQAIYATYAQDPEVTKYLVWRPHQNIKETMEFLERIEHSWEKGSEYTWAITLKESGILIGMIGLRMSPPRADFGYVLARPFWNNGYTTEAAAIVADWALRQKNIYRLWSVCDTDNLASARVLEKVGLEREGILRYWMYHSTLNEPRDCFCYSKIKK